MDLRSTLLDLSDRYCVAAQLSKPRLATLLVNDGKFFDRIEGGGGFTIRTYERAIRWFSDHWPADTAWPEGVTRPDPVQADTEAAAE